MDRTTDCWNRDKPIKVEPVYHNHPLNWAYKAGLHNVFSSGDSTPFTRDEMPKDNGQLLEFIELFSEGQSAALMMKNFQSEKDQHLPLGCEDCADFNRCYTLNENLYNFNL